MAIDVSRVIVPYRSIARMLDGLESTEPRVPTDGGLEGFQQPGVNASRSDSRGGVEMFEAPGAGAGDEPGDGGDALPAGMDELQHQKMLDELRDAARIIARADRRPGVLYAPDDKAASLLLSFMAQKAVDESRLEELPNGGMEVAFDDNDVGSWITTFLAAWAHSLTNKRAFLGNPSTTPVDLGNGDVRLAILGDWGTGLYGAPRCARSILDTAPAYTMVMHLGDVYYTGNLDEVKTRFLDVWPTVPGARSLALNSNHEMYSGGEGYFDLTLPKFKQSASYFAYQTDNFVLIGLDTGYAEYTLAGNQDGWLDEIVRNAGDRKVVLFSHHQPFSLYERKSMKRQSRLGALLDQKRIFAWYWGHEHRCVVYDTHPGWGLKGRCIGHSGYPYFRANLEKYPLKNPVNRDGSAWRQLGTTNGTPGGYILDGQNFDVADDPNRFGPHGYASIHLSGPNLLERIHAADGTVLHELQLA
jgi:calcineurin-like phosphoesterase family protein